MTKTKLEKELKAGASFFRVLGKAKITSETFPEDVTVSKTGWQYKRINFPVAVGENNTIYVQMMGGHASEEPVVYVFNKDNEMFKVKWDLRNNEDVLENVAPRSFIHVRLEKDEKGKLIDKKFISELDAIDYIGKHLNNDDDVYIGGSVEYQRYNDEVQRSLNINSITLLEKEYQPLAEMRQTYLVDHTAIPRDFEKKLEESKKVKLNVFVPQYIGKENGKEIKQTLALPQQITYPMNDKGLDVTTKGMKYFFDVSKKVVREITLVNKMVYGVEETTGQVELTPELKELIDLGLMTEEEIKAEATTNGKRVDETIFGHVAIGSRNDPQQIMMADRYAPEALVVPESDIEEDDTFSDADSTNEAVDVFADEELFS